MGLGSRVTFGPGGGARQGENPARWHGHFDKLLPARAKVRGVKHHAALPFGEVIGARPDEIKDEVWTVPAERMKSATEHRVPLSAPALAIVGKMRKETWRRVSVPRRQARQAPQQHGDAGRT